MQTHEIVSREDWIAARRDLLTEEKAWTRERDRLARKRRALPWVRVDKDYVFESTDGPARLSDLFDGRSQLVVHHFHVRSGLAGRLPGLLPVVRPCRRRAAAFRA